MDEMKKIVQNNDYLIPRIAKKAGVSKFKFYKYIHENGLEPVSRGVYSTGDNWKDELYVLHQRCPKAVFSHDEAFYYHGLTDREPLVHTFTIYSGYNAHRLTADGSCKVYSVKKELLDVGKTMVKDNSGNRIPMYDLERTICDLVRSRNSIEAQDFSSVIKTYVSGKDKNLNRLMEYAKLFRVDNVIRRYMEVLL
ncbi:putative transcriptional regulator of viral defense system [Aequitasia blattaphilus]|uniref:Abortive phage infection protein n=1 Tax=Aequitasia blattaphilus TaxID=2949332 RepID=A0ABT1EEW9_9FIRM|nr:abortive phage infection protein [Aequitasia blattaphilus]MCP1103487.1 abortive phage infection protein [Aequitasia blattaphilus]MCR8616127.1 abortive phage infection protein [Aequitasia blattaphilus]